MHINYNLLIGAVSHFTIWKFSYVIFMLHIFLGVLVGVWKVSEWCAHCME